MNWRLVISLAIVGTLCGCPGIASAVVHHDRQIPQPDPDQLPITQADHPHLSDVTFVGDPAEFESTCWYWDMAPGGSLAVEVPIGRAVGAVPALIKHGLMDSLAIIRVAAFDVDYYESHFLTVNGHELESRIEGVTCGWFVHKDTIPVGWLEFPAMGQNGSLPDPKVNRIGIKISPDGSPPYDCLSIDWVSITIRVARPVLFVHGANDNGETWWPEFDPGLTQYAGVPTSRDLTMTPPPIDRIINNASKIDAAVEGLRTATGSEMVNLVGHSKGGIDARYYSGICDNVERVIQIGSPNCGVTWGSLLAYTMRSMDYTMPVNPLRIANQWLGPGGEELTLDGMKRFNRSAGAYNIDVDYTAIGCLYWPPSLWSVLNIVFNPEWMGDGFVPLWSTHCINNFSHITKSGLPGSPENAEFWHGKQPHSTSLMESAVSPVLEEYGATSVPIGAEPPQTTIAFQGDIGEGSTATGAVDVDAMVPTSIGLYYPSGEMDLTMRSPSGVLYTRESMEGNPDVGWEDIEIPGGRVEAVSFLPPELGRWTIEVEAVDVVEPGDSAAFIATAHMTEPPLVLNTELPRTDLVAGDTLVVVGTLTRDAAAASADSVRAIVIGPNGVPARVVMLDDGVAPDSLMNDGHFTGNYLIPSGGVGVYSVICNAKGSYQGIPFSRASGGAATATASRSACAGVTGSVARDTDGNGYYDKLEVTVSVSATAAATCIVRALLRDSQGGSHAGTATVSLTPGMQPVVVAFSGKALGQSRVDGPYQIVEVRMAEIGDDGLLPCGVWPTSHSTEPYTFREFEHSPVKVTGAASSVGVSTTGDADYEYLDVSVAVDVDADGAHAWWGRLYDAQGLPIGGMAEGRGTLVAGGDSIILRFPGACIRRNGVDGPFYVKDLILAGPQATDFASGSFATDPHPASSFANFSGPAATLYIEDDSLSVCPAGDLDTLRMKLFIPHTCGSETIDGPLPKVWARDINPEYSATIWDAVTPTDPNGDSLYAYEYHPGAAQDTALFEASAISGCGVSSPAFNNPSGRLDLQFEVEGNPVRLAPVINLMNVDLDRRSYGTVDRLDSTRYVQMSVYTGPSQCSNLNWNAAVDSADATIFATHLGHRHHIGRRLVTPNGGEIFAPGSGMSIGWEAGHGDSARVHLRLLSDQSTDSIGIAVNDPDDGAFSWTVPTTVPPGTQYRVKVVHTVDRYPLETLGTDRSDGTITIRPRPVQNLVVSTGRTSAALSWSEPGQAGGEADEYEIRYLVNTTITEENFDSGDSVSGPAPGGPGTPHCLELPGLGSCRTYSFAIRTKDNGASSYLSNVANGNTACSGNSIAFCDGEGLMAGGGSGGEEGLRGSEMATSAAPTGVRSPIEENSILWWGGADTDVRDLRHLGTGRPPEGSYRVHVRELENRRSKLDQVSLGAVDHLPAQLAVAGTDQVLLGTPGAVRGITTADGLDFPARAPDDSTYTARAGEVLLVELGQSSAGTALVLETRGAITGAKTDSIGIAVDRLGRDSSWVRAAVLHPRRGFDRTAVLSGGSPKMRVTFLRDYQLRSVETLEGVTVPPLASMALASAVHSRLGATTTAVRDSGDLGTTVVPGDSLNLEFTLTPVPSGLVRSLFLLARGSYARRDSAGPEESRIATAAAAAPSFEFALGAAYPNPSDGSLTIRYTLARQTPTLLRVYNVVGREIRTLVDGEQMAGPQESLWDGRDNGGRRVPPGVYFYRLQAGAWHSERKLIMLQR